MGSKGCWAAGFAEGSEADGAADFADAFDFTATAATAFVVEVACVCRKDGAVAGAGATGAVADGEGVADETSGTGECVVVALADAADFCTKRGSLVEGIEATTGAAGEGGLDSSG